LGTILAFSFFASTDVPSVDDIPRGEGAVMRRGLHLVATYRDEAGSLHECSAVCPHLKGVVHWNEVEKTWDCPCHGSRFDARGRVMNGPAATDLAPLDGIEAPSPVAAQPPRVTERNPTLPAAPSAKA
jgi:nitrite reductase/ring-hydroxylating ferredoxin subunit